MGYYDVYLKRQTEIMDESMEAAARELAGVVQSEKAYREYLQSQLTAMDKQVAAYKKAARSSGGLTGEQNFKLFNAQRAVNNDLNAQVKGVKDFSLKVDKATRFDSTSLSLLNDDFMEAATKPRANAAVRAVVNLALTNEKIDKLKGGAAQSHELASQSYAIDLKGWMVDQLENAGQQLSPQHLKAIEDGVFQITGVNPALQTQQSLEAKRTRLQETTVGEIPITAYRSARELRKLQNTLVDLNDEQRSAIQLRIEQLEEEGGGRDAIEDRLEALGAPTEITAEAVRARAAEIAKPQLYDPYARQREAVGERREQRLADLVEGRETRSVWDKTPRMEDARIRRLERLTGANDLATQFDKLSEDQKIMMTQGVRALQNYRAGGSVLPEDQGSIEWQRANEMYSQLGAGTLVGGNNAIRVATELAQADLGSGAPASDVRRHRDEIMERFLMLTLNEKNATAASTPTQEAKERPPEDPALPDWEASYEESLQMSPEERREQMLAGLAEDEAVRARREQMLEDLARFEARRQTESGNGLEPSPEVEAEQVIQERVQGPVRMEEGPEGTFSASEIKTDSLGFTPIDVPGEPLGTSEVSIPLPPAPGQSDIAVPTIAAPTLMQTFFPRAENPEDQGYRKWIAAGADAVKAGARPVGQEIAEQVPELLEEFSGMYKGSMAERATVEFSESTSKIPGNPRYHDLLARAAQAMGLPLPAWYAEATPGAQVSIRKTGASI